MLFDLQKVVVVEWSVPTSTAEVWSYLSCACTTDTSCKTASVVAPPHQLTRKGECFRWSEACQATFDCLNKALEEAPLLPYPDPRLPYLLDIDSRPEGIRAVLSQIKDEECVMAYYSSKFSEPESNNEMMRKELLTVVKS